MFLIRPSSIRRAFEIPEITNVDLFESILEPPKKKLCMRQFYEPSSFLLEGDSTPNTVESDKSVQLSLDVPGVKVKDVSIQLSNDNSLQITAERKSGDNVSAKYYQEYHVNDRKFDASNITATLEDGVLTVTIPKKVPKDPVSVQVQALSPPERNEITRDHFHVEFDLPGVKVNELELKVHEGFVHISGNRTKGNDKFKFKNKASFNEYKFDASNLKAYLADGVLTLIAPPKDKSASPKKSHDSRIIPLSITNGASDKAESIAISTPEKSAAPEKSTTPKDDNNGQQQSDMVVVETVKEKDEQTPK